SVINWGEVYYLTFRAKGEEKAEDVLLVMEQLPINIVDIDTSLMYQAARLKANHSISIGDCIAAALAMNKGYPVLTGDKEFKKLGEKLRVEWVR
ncbi:MAG: type II toxin-antitoxin system VapC family toxin, partial [Deltaproteobacteria bacterium]|nr:type II toxin-antitoxin system VapC family toxin [Deltaproteobacteria bacterium]